MRELSGLVTAGSDWLGFLRTAYALDALVAQFTKQVTARMHGVTMGGGLGLAAPASRRIVEESTYMAMPETKIGFFPDSGVMFHLSRSGGVVPQSGSGTAVQSTERQVRSALGSAVGGTARRSRWAATTSAEWTPQPSPASGSAVWAAAVVLALGLCSALLVRRAANR